jgi:N-acetylmuramidase
MFSQTQYQDTAKLLGCDIATIKAVAEVESAGECFTRLGKLLCLFEGHKFYKYTEGKYAKSHPTLCYKRWTKQFYKKTSDAEYTERFMAASTLDQKAAMLSCSWGAFQILGEHHIRLGFDQVDDMLYFLKEKADNHLVMFGDFVISDPKLLKALRQKDWTTFARIYNGPEYKQNAYDVKLAMAYKKYAR